MDQLAAPVAVRRDFRIAHGIGGQHRDGTRRRLAVLGTQVEGGGRLQFVHFSTILVHS